MFFLRGIYLSVMFTFEVTNGPIRAFHAHRTLNTKLMETPMGHQILNGSQLEQQTLFNAPINLLLPFFLFIVLQ